MWHFDWTVLHPFLVARDGFDVSHGLEQFAMTDAFSLAPCASSIIHGAVEHFDRKLANT